MLIARLTGFEPVPQEPHLLLRSCVLPINYRRYPRLFAEWRGKMINYSEYLTMKLFFLPPLVSQRTLAQLV